MWTHYNRVHAMVFFYDKAATLAAKRPYRAWSYCQHKTCYISAIIKKITKA